MEYGMSRQVGCVITAVRAAALRTTRRQLALLVFVHGLLPSLRGVGLWLVISSRTNPGGLRSKYVTWQVSFREHGKDLLVVWY